MTTQTKADIDVGEDIAVSKAKLTQKDVAGYLRAHNNFFTHHSELIETLTIPHETGVAISLVERQVELLRKKNKELDHKLRQLITVAKDNEHVSRKLHSLTLDIFSIKGFDSTLRGIQELLHADFPATRIKLRLFDNLPDTKVQECDYIDNTLLKSKLVQDLFSNRRRGVAFLSKRQIGNIFEPKKGIKPILSAAAVLLKNKESVGVLFLGSTDVNRFKSGMGILFLGNLGEVIAAKLHQFVRR